ncbi:hypothetical protein OG250_38325 [Streptomyces sp. NBC_00487]|nr:MULTISPECIES: hypothetical protein [unclassified Streptomyces]
MRVRRTGAVEITALVEERVPTRSGRAATRPATVVTTHDDGS